MRFSYVVARGGGIFCCVCFNPADYAVLSMSLCINCIRYLGSLSFSGVLTANRRSIVPSYRQHLLRSDCKMCNIPQLPASQQRRTHHSHPLRPSSVTCVSSSGADVHMCVCGGGGGGHECGRKGNPRKEKVRFADKRCRLKPTPESRCCKQQVSEKRNRNGKETRYGDV